MSESWLLPMLLATLNTSKFAIPLYVSNYHCYYRYGGDE